MNDTSQTPCCVCPTCGKPEVEASTPHTVYACGSRDYDQRPGTFRMGDNCKQPMENDSRSSDCSALPDYDKTLWKALIAYEVANFREWNEAQAKWRFFNHAHTNRAVKQIALIFSQNKKTCDKEAGE
jgi:hypothetical protein